MGQSNNREQRAVLVIDRDTFGAEHLQEHLVKGGYRVYAAGTLDEALKVVREKSVVVALLVLGRQSFDPGRCSQRLQRISSVGKIPVIVILERFSEDIVVSALKSGAADYLVQPVDFLELIRRIGVYARLDEIHVGDDEAKMPGIHDIESPVSKKGLLARVRLKLLDIVQFRFRTDEFLEHRYEKLTRLGIGSFGEVWKIRDLANEAANIFVAKIPISKKLDPKIKKEARILRMLAGHAAVPDVHEVLEANKKSVLVQEYVEGKTLQEVMERELEDAEIKSIIFQLVDVVAHAHDLGVIHRDIKPGNVMVKPDGTIKLLDFGAAKELKGTSMSDTVIGSRPYMSPEQIMGQSQRRSDVWALGVIMYVLYTGLLPFYHEVEKVLMDMILEIPAAPPSKHRAGLDPGIERIILKCLEKNPKERYSDAGTLKKALNAIFPDKDNNVLPLF
jgi:CheY-like chemotaxis protein